MLSAVEESLTVTVTLVVWLPSEAVSSTPVTVTVWGVFQLSAVNVNVAGPTVVSPVSAFDKVNTTVPVGSESNTTVNVSVVSASDTAAVVPDRVKPAVSSSVVVTLTVWSARESKVSSELASLTDSVTVEVWLPSSTSSLMPVTVIVWATFQLPVVKVRDAADTVASPVSLLATSTTTFDDGSAVNTTVNVCVDPVSATVRADSDTVKPGAPHSSPSTARCSVISVMVAAFLAAYARCTLHPDGTTPVAEPPAPS